MKISVLIGSRNRPAILKQCLESVLAQHYEPFEVIVLDDASSEANAYAHLLRQVGDERVRLIRSERQLGVAEGRNYLFQQATGDIFFVLDDDAVLISQDALERQAQVFAQYTDVGIVACKILESDHSMQKKKVPFSKHVLRSFPHIDEKAQLVSYFLGGAHGIRKQVIETCGSYHPDLRFGEEELDLAYRAVAHQWKIYYEPAIVVCHFPQPSVIDQDGQRCMELFHHIKNRIYIVYRYLPMQYALVHLMIWLGIYIGMALRAGCPAVLAKGIIAGIQMAQRVRREPLNRVAIRYLQEHFGRLWY